MAKRKPYKDVAERMLAAVRELNAAVVEAHEHPHVRVHMCYPKHETIPAQYGCEVTRITKHEVVLAKASAWQVAEKLVFEHVPAKKRATKKLKIRGRKVV